MKKLIALLIALLLTTPALAEGWRESIPAGAAAVQLEERVYRLTVEETGEVLLLTVDETGAPLRLETEVPASAEGAGEQSREGAEAAVQLEYPTGRVLSAELAEDGSRTLAVLADDLCGMVEVRGEKIVSRALDFGEFAKDGRLTQSGALAALKLLRPEAEIVEIELDEDDGILLYEGEAYIGDIEYEFELNAQTGRLLEWDRD